MPAHDLQLVDVIGQAERPGQKNLWRRADQDEHVQRFVCFHRTSDDVLDPRCGSVEQKNVVAHDGQTDKTQMTAAGLWMACQYDAGGDIGRPILLAVNDQGDPTVQERRRSVALEFCGTFHKLSRSAYGPVNLCEEVLAPAGADALIDAVLGSKEVANQASGKTFDTIEQHRAGFCRTPRRE